MQLALPRPAQNLAVPFLTLVLGAAGGVAATVALNDDEIIRVPAISQPAAVQQSSPIESTLTNPVDPAVQPNKFGPRVGGGDATAPELRGSKASSTGTTDTSTSDNSFGPRP